MSIRQKNLLASVQVPGQQPGWPVAAGPECL